MLTPSHFCRAARYANDGVCACCPSSLESMELPAAYAAAIAAEYPGARNFARKGQSITFTYDDPDSGEAVDVLLKPEK